MTERYIEDDCGIIDMQTKDTYDYVSEVVGLLNKQETKLKRIKEEVDCNVYRDDLKSIILKIRCILNGD